MEVEGAIDHRLGSVFDVAGYLEHVHDVVGAEASGVDPAIPPETALICTGQDRELGHGRLHRVHYVRSFERVSQIQHEVQIEVIPGIVEAVVDSVKNLGWV